MIPMSTHLHLHIPALAALAALVPAGWLAAADYSVKPVPFTDVSFTGGIWQNGQEINNKVTLPFALGRLETFKRIRHPRAGIT
jgi:hypothetical protein